MKKIIGILLIAMSLNAYSQEVRTAIFTDGREIEFEMLSVDAKDIPKLNIWIFDMNSRATFSFGTSIAYSMPDHFLSKFHIGAGGNGLSKISIENTIFFKTFNRTKDFKINLAGDSYGNTTTKYKVRTPLIARRQLGIRLGYLHGDFTQDVYANHDVYKSNELSVGFSCVNTKYHKVKRYTNPKTGAKAARTSYYIELLYNHMVTGIEYNSLTNEDENFPLESNFGYRIGLDGQVGGRFGMSYIFGFEKPPAADKYFDVFWGFGLYLNFL